MFGKSKVTKNNSHGSQVTTATDSQLEAEKCVELGKQAEGQGNLKRAESWYTRAAEAGSIDARFQLAVLAYRGSDINQARTWLARATADGNLENINDAGLCARDFGDFEECEQYYKKAAEGGLAVSMLNYARVLRDHKEYDAAQSWYLIALNAGELTAYCQLGITEQWRGNETEAQKWFHKGAAAGDAWSMKLLGDTAQDAENLPEAKKWYQQSAELGYAPAMRLLGLLLVQENETAQARNWLGQAANKGDAQAMRFLGELAFDDGDSQEALTWWDKAARAGNVEAVTAMATFFKDEGDLSYAKELFEIAANDGDPDAMNQLAIMLDAENLYDDATAWYEKAADAGNLWAINQMAMRAMRLGDWDTAKQRWQLAAQHGEADSMWHLGLCAENDGDLALAKEWFQKAVDNSAEYSDKSIRDYRTALLRVEQALGSPSGASKVSMHDGATEPIKEDFSESDGWIERGLKALDEENPKGAEKWFLKAAEAGNPVAMVYLASLAYGADDQIKGNMWYQRGLNDAQTINDAEKLAFIGDYASQNKHYERAAEMYQRAAELGSVPAMVELGICLNQLNKDDDAETWFQKAAELGNPAAMFNVGLLAAKNGKTTESVSWFEKAAAHGVQEAMVELGSLLQHQGNLDQSNDWYYQAALWLLQNDQRFCEMLPHGIPIYSWNYDAEQVREFPGDLGSIEGTFYGYEGTCGLMVDGGFVGVPSWNTIEGTLASIIDRLKEVNQLYELPEFRDAELKILEILDHGATYSKTQFEQVANSLISALKDPYFKGILAQPAPLPEPEELRHRARSILQYSRDNLKSIGAIPELTELKPSVRRLVPSFYPMKRKQAMGANSSPTK